MLYNKYIIYFVYIFLAIVILGCKVPLSYLLKLTSRLLLIQLSLSSIANIIEDIFNLNGDIVYYLWSYLVIFFILVLLLRLPLNKNNIFQFITSILLILIIGGLVGNCIDCFIVHKECYYTVNMGKSLK